MAKRGRIKDTASKSKRVPRRSHRRAKKASVAFRSSVALARATELFVDLHQKIQNFVLTDLEAYVDASSLQLDAPLPAPINKVSVMVILVGDFRKAITQDPSWGVDPAKLTLSGPELWSKIQAPPQQRRQKLSYLIQFIYQRAHDALRT